jgi:hypothetical protein
LTTSNTWSWLRLLVFPACAQGKIKEKAKIRKRIPFIDERAGFLQGGRFKESQPKFNNPCWQQLMGCKGGIRVCLGNMKGKH